jgi:hypothetical protein
MCAVSLFLCVNVLQPGCQGLRPLHCYCAVVLLAFGAVGGALLPLYVASAGGGWPRTESRQLCWNREPVCLFCWNHRPADETECYPFATLCVHRLAHCRSSRWTQPGGGLRLGLHCPAAPAAPEPPRPKRRRLMMPWPPLSHQPAATAAAALRLATCLISCRARLAGACMWGFASGSHYWPPPPHPAASSAAAVTPALALPADGSGAAGQRPAPGAVRGPPLPCSASPH